MKQIKNVITAVALCAILSTNAKQVGKKTITNEPKPTPTPYVQPIPAPRPQPQPIQQQQPKGPQKEYTQILNQLQRMNPTHDDWNTLKVIKDEVSEQMGAIYDPALAKSQSKKEPAPQPKVDTPTTKTHAEEVREIKRKTENPKQVITDDVKQLIRNSVYTNRKHLIAELITNPHGEHTKTEYMLKHYFKEYPNINPMDIINAVYLAIIYEDDIKNVLQEDPSKEEAKTNTIWGILTGIYLKSTPMNL